MITTTWYTPDIKPKDGTQILFIERIISYSKQEVQRGTMYIYTNEEGVEFPQIVCEAAKTNCSWKYVKFWAETPEEFKEL